VQVVKDYQRPRISASVIQIMTSLVPYLLLWPLMVWSLSISYLLTLPLTVLASGFLIRTFIIQHDCGHGSFFRSKRWNAIVGNVCSFFSLTPYDYWRTSHAIHHAHNGDLNHRGTGDIFTMTLQEYSELDRRGRFIYRLYRSPFVMFTVGAAVNFLILQRAPIALKTARNEAGRRSIIRTDIAITVIFLLTVWVIGLKAFLMIYIPLMWLTATLGVWLFYVQHQFEDVYWSQDPDWTYSDAALKGSTYFRLPKVLQWFTGNIGLHHIHHLSPLIPNYELQRCHDENPEFQTVVTITLWDAIQIVRRQYGLWDEERGQLLTFGEAKQRLAELNA
jgi:omega-6 fatty acid desaturase (delta-12 desaturase)